MNVRDAIIGQQHSAKVIPIMQSHPSIPEGVGLLTPKDYGCGEGVICLLVRRQSRGRNEEKLQDGM